MALVALVGRLRPTWVATRREVYAFSDFLHSCEFVAPVGSEQPTGGTWELRRLWHAPAYFVQSANKSSRRDSGLLEQTVEPEQRAARFLKSMLVGRGPVNRVVLFPE